MSNNSNAADLIPTTGEPDIALVETLYIMRRKRAERTRAALLDHQKVPTGPWSTWVIMAGRGSGKTYAGVNAVVEHLREFGPDAWVMIIAPTGDDARDVILEGPSGLWTLFRNEFVSYHRTLLKLKHIGGGQVKVFSGDEPNRLRGPQSTLLWIDEIAIQDDETIDNARFGNRLGPDPKFIATTTPKKRASLKSLLNEPGVVVTRATTDDNPHLSEKARVRLYDKYGGTRLGRQELKGELIEDIDGAMFKSAWIDDARVSVAPELERVVVAIDPAASTPASNGAGKKARRKKGAETGQVVAGRGVDGDYYVLFGDGYRVTPGTWARKAIELYDQFGADHIIGEKNNGGDMVEHTIRQEWDDAPFSTVWASRGKSTRAEPVALLCEQGRVHFVGVFPELENQLYAFPVEDELKDILDAFVWAITFLMDDDGNETLLMSRLGDGKFSNSAN